MAKAFDYELYGAFKRPSERTHTLRSIARSLGLKNRYLRFVRHWDRAAPVVELGAGDGHFIDELRSAGFRNVRGCDCSPSYFGRADIEVSNATTCLRNVAPASLGNIVAFDTFEHIPVQDLKDLLILARSRLRSGGELLFRVPSLTSSLSLAIQFGDLSHTTAFNEHAVKHLAFETGFDVVSIDPEPLSYPTNLRAAVGILLWPLFREMMRCALAAFGQRVRIVTPSMVCTLRHPAVTP